MSGTFTCPRTLDTTMAAAYIGGFKLNPDEFSSACDDLIKNPGPARWRDTDHGRTCSHCGSLHPDDFMERVRRGDEVGPTDKNYKVYLDNPWAKFYTVHLTREHAGEFRRLYFDGRVLVGYPGWFYHGIYLHPAPAESEVDA